MKKINLNKFLLIALIAGLIAGNIYFFNESKKTENRIIIGTPVNTYRTNCSKPIKDKNHSRSIQFALIDAISIDKPAIVEKLPDAIIIIADWSEGIGYYAIRVWFDNNKVIFAMGKEDSHFGTDYKEAVAGWGDEIKDIISHYKT